MGEKCRLKIQSVSEPDRYKYVEFESMEVEFDSKEPADKDGLYDAVLVGVDKDMNEWRFLVKLIEVQTPAEVVSPEVVQ